MIRTAARSELRPKERGTRYGVCRALFVLAKPGIVAAVTLSGLAGMILAGKGLPDPSAALLGSLSVSLMAFGAALTNSVLDRRMDRCMERLALRSAALERLGNGPALIAASAATSTALLIPSAALNPIVVLLLVAASLSYVVCYTLWLKPHTHWAAVLGAIPGALPALAGSAVVNPALDRSSFALFLVLLLWQPPHFWLLSLSRIEEYRKAGVPVLPLARGIATTRRCTLLFALALIPASLLLWSAGPCSKGYALVAVLLGASFLFACRFYLQEGRDCRTAFRGSILYLLLLLLTVIIDLAR